MSETQAFLTHLQEHFNSCLGNDVLSAYREKGWQQLLNLGLPAKSQEAYRYVPLRELYLSSFDPSQESLLDKSLFADAILPECKHSHIVFIDGRFSFQLSDVSALPQQTVLLPLDEALSSHASFLQSHFSRYFKEEKEAFSLINLALHSKGAFFYLPPKIKLTTPIQCLHVMTALKPRASFPRLYLALGSESQMHWITSYHDIHSAAASHLLVPTTEISLEEGAIFNLLNIVDAMPTSWHLESVRATVKKNARLQSLSVTTGAKIVRQSYRVQLKGENSEANLNGLWMLSKNRTSHVHAVVDHEAPHTRSMQRFRGALNDASQSSFEGKILVREAAQKTEAYQLNNNLILSQGAVANSKPNLEVFADDVKASHGATISQLDEQQLFYLSTRGIGPLEAKRLLVGGFCREMIEQIPYASIVQKMQRHIETFIHSGGL